MVFNSAAFLFIFIPISFLLSRVIPGKRGKDILLCILSVLFYACGGLQQLPFLLGALLWDWAWGKVLRKTESKKKLFLGISVGGNVLLLALCKCTGTLPLGISFFTFHGISYLVDLYRDPTCGADSFWETALYLAFFPRLLAGPIVRYSEATAELQNRVTTLEDTAAGLRRFSQGLVKKLILSEGLATMVNTVYGSEIGSFGIGIAWIGAIGYCLQLYYDFSGYSDMAIGLGQLFGFHFPENFDYPYVSGSVTEFWRRWHITLNRWFVQYLYIPLGGSRCGKGRAFLNRMLVFLATGLWHGLGWTYILWGLWHGLFVSLEGLKKELIQKLQRKLPGKIGMHIYALLVVILGFVMFRAESMSQGLYMIGKMFSFGSAGVGRITAETLLPTSQWIVLGLSGLFALPIVPKIKALLPLTNTQWELVGNILAILGLLFGILAMAGGNFSPFIYQKF